ncbi:hypothetical protein [Limnochorda pilosa]|uniref:Uncharacterized protein n=1 Tax=Limnochorda pilosa TaxID=1555112 RepID=A0A0K2SHK6_LIMPI|nr:hypothetical protein [Limnochorda pilosa]BAS26575.1 hypothetical protein LIP_0718 [Limnochorda pilosa]
MARRGDGAGPWWAWAALLAALAAAGLGYASARAAYRDVVLSTYLMEARVRDASLVQQTGQIRLELTFANPSRSARMEVVSLEFQVFGGDASRYLGYYTVTPSDLRPGPVALPPGTSARFQVIQQMHPEVLEDLNQLAAGIGRPGSEAEGTTREPRPEEAAPRPLRLALRGGLLVRVTERGFSRVLGVGIETELHPLAGEAP